MGHAHAVASPKKVNVIALSPERGGGVSAVVVSANGGRWSDVGHCGQSHLLEHVIGRQIYDKLGRNLSDSGAWVEAYTSVDRISITVIVGGGEDGLYKALKAIDDSQIVTVKNPIVEQERKLIELERNISSPSASLNALLDTVNVPNIIGRAGDCFDESNAKIGNRGLSIFDISIASELSSVRVEKILEVSGVDLRDRITVKPLYESKVEQSSSFFQPISAADLAGNGIIWSLAFWHWALKGEDSPRFVPVGAIGYLVKFPTSRSLPELARVRRAFQQARVEEVKAAWMAGRTVFCTNRARQHHETGAVGLNFGTDEWARHATFNAACDGPVEPFLKSDAESAASAPIALVSKAEDVSKMSTSPAGKVLTVCGSRPTFLPRFAGYFSSLLAQAILEEFRFERGLVLSTNQSEAPKGCIAARIVGLAADHDISDWLDQLSSHSTQFDDRIYRAHRRQCVLLPLSRRIELGDQFCNGNPKPKSLEILRDLLQSGNYEWN